MYNHYSGVQLYMLCLSRELILAMAFINSGVFLTTVFFIFHDCGHLINLFLLHIFYSKKLNNILNKQMKPFNYSGHQDLSSLIRKFEQNIFKKLAELGTHVIVRTLSGILVMSRLPFLPVFTK